MKNLFVSVLATIIAIALIYALASFYNLSTNPALWSEGGRFIFCALTFIITFIAIGYYNVTKNYL